MLGALGIASGAVVAVIVLSIILAIIAKFYSEWISVGLIFLGLMIFAGIVGYSEGKRQEKLDELFGRKGK